MAKSEKSAADLSTIESLCAHIDKIYGSGSIHVGDGSVISVDTFPSGIISFDHAIGCSGIPLGRIVEIYGPESSGKTTTCIQIMAACQQHYFASKNRNGVVMFIDAEHAFDPHWASQIGVDVSKVLFSQPDSGEEALDIAETAAGSKLVDLIVIDSVAALTPKAILDGSMEDNHVGALPRLLTKGVNKLTPVCSSSDTTVIFINQIREKIGMMFGNPETTPGGRALKHGASIRIEVKKSAAIKEKDEIIGFTTIAKFAKNKIARPNTSCSYNIMFGGPRKVYGIDKSASLLSTAMQLGIVKMSGSSISIVDTKEIIGNGYNNAYLALDDSCFYNKLADKVKAAMDNIGNTDEFAKISDQ